ncbi:TonB-dependent receptor [soil metagenome]
MQKIPLQLGTILLTVVIGVGGATSDALSQGIALSNKEVPAIAVNENLQAQKNMKPLTKVLAELEGRFKVNFNYDSDRLEGIFININSDQARQMEAHNLEKSLNSLLTPLNLGYEKLKSNLYLIYPLKKGRAGAMKPTGSGSFSSSTLPVWEQSAFTVSGKVTDNSGQGLPGVSVVVKGTTVGVSTDGNGAFALNAPDGNVTLVFSYIGFAPQEVAVDGRSVINITLTPDTKALGEVVVVGYGKQKRENVIGSVAQVSAEQIANRPVTQLSNALTGQMAGVTVVQRTGRPGSSAGNISVRGIGSFGAGPGALVIVDGIPGDFNDIDPNDVESVSVLKDASSAAIYGARAANGVILVTTKTGKAGKVQVSYNGYTGFQKPTAFPDFVNSWEYAELFNEASGSVSYTPADIQKFRDGSDLDNYPNTDFMSAVFTERGTQTGHNISISSGTASTQYNLSLGYLYQDGIVVKNNFDRFNVRLNMVTALSPKLDLTTRLAGIRTSVNEPGPPASLDSDDFLSIINHSVRYPAIYPGKLSNGYYGAGVVQKGTPISFLETESFMRGKGTNLNANLRLDYKIINDLKLSVIAAYNQIDNNRRTFKASQVINPNIILGPNHLTLNNNTTNYYTVQGLAEYTKQIDKHQIGVLAGYSFEDNKFEQFEAFRDKLPGNALTQIDVGSPDNQKASGTGSEWAIESFFGRVNYNLANKYLVEGVIRYDGSSRFPTSQKYATFPSAAVGWRVGQESFIQDNFSWIDELKLKASVGILGNQNIPNYPYQNTYNIGPAYNYSFGGTIFPGVARTTIVDSTLHWESTRTTDLGVEMAIFKNKLNFSATYFDRYSYDILYSPGGSVSSTLGFGLSQQNTGRLRNSGWEFTVGHNHSVGKFSYFVNTNFSIINNKVLDLGVGNISQLNGMVGNGSTLFIGHPMQIFYGYVADGIFVDKADVDAYSDQKAINPNAQPGDIRYKDISGPDGVPDGKVDPVYDRMVLGSSIPKYTFGINLGANYGGFDLNLLLQGVSGVRGLMDGYAGYAFFNFGSVQRWQMEERWTAENPRADAGYPRLELISNSGTPNTLLSSFWVINGSYLRFKNVQIGYTLPASLVQKARIGSVRFYVSGENMLTFSNYRQGWDPEVGTSNPNNTVIPVTANGHYHPIMANFTFGLNVRF